MGSPGAFCSVLFVLLLVLPPASATNNQGGLGTCSVHAYSTVVNEMLKLTVDEAVNERTLRTMISSFAAVDGKNLFDGSRSADITNLINKRGEHFKIEDSDNRGVLQLSILELPLVSHLELAQAVSQTPGVSSTYISARTAQGSHAIAGTRLYAGDVPSPSATVMGRNSHGGHKSWWPVDPTTFLGASMLVPIVWNREEFDPEKSSMVSMGAPELTEEFEKVRDLYYPSLAGGFRAFDRVTSSDRHGSRGVVVGRGTDAVSLEVAFFYADTVKRIQVPASALSHLGGQTPSKLLSGSLYRRGDKVYSFVATGEPQCLRVGTMVGDFHQGKGVVAFTDDGGKSQNINMPERLMGLVDEYQPFLLDFPWKIGDQVRSTVVRAGWMSKKGQPTKLMPGDPGTVLCYSKAGGDILHVMVDFGHVEGSLPAEALVDPPGYDATMAEELGNGLRRGEKVMILNGEHQGTIANVEGPHPEYSQLLRVALPGVKSMGGVTVSLVSVKASDLMKVKGESQDFGSRDEL